MSRRPLALLTEASHNLERASVALSQEQLREMAGEARKLRLGKLRESSQKLERAAFWTVERDHDVARDCAAIALLTLAEALGVDERGIEAMRCILVASDCSESDYSSAHKDGRIEVRP